MPNPAPQTAANLLLKRVSQAVSRLDTSDFEILRLEQDAKRLLESDAVGAYQALGAIAAYRLDLDALRENHERAIHLTTSVTARSNYAISLERVGLYSEANPWVLEASKTEPENLTYLHRALTSHLLSGDIETANELANTFRRRQPDTEDLFVILAPRIKAVLDERGISQIELQKSLEIAYLIIREHHWRLPNTTIQVQSHDGDHAVIYRTRVYDTWEQVSNADAELAQRLAETLENMHPSTIAIMIDPAPQNEPKTPAAA